MARGLGSFEHPLARVKGGHGCPVRPPDSTETTPGALDSLGVRSFGRPMLPRPVESHEAAETLLICVSDEAGGRGVDRRCAARQRSGHRLVGAQGGGSRGPRRHWAAHSAILVAVAFFPVPFAGRLSGVRLWSASSGRTPKSDRLCERMPARIASSFASFADSGQRSESISRSFLGI